MFLHQKDANLEKGGTFFRNAIKMEETIWKAAGKFTSKLKAESKQASPKLY